MMSMDYRPCRGTIVASIVVDWYRYHNNNMDHVVDLDHFDDGAAILPPPD